MVDARPVPTFRARGGTDAVQWNPAVWISDGRQFATEVRSEFKKISWPARKEAIGGTIGVVVIVTIITIALGLVDFVLGRVVPPLRDLFS